MGKTSFIMRKILRDYRLNSIEYNQGDIPRDMVTNVKDWNFFYLIRRVY